LPDAEACRATSGQSEAKESNKFPQSNAIAEKETLEFDTTIMVHPLGAASFEDFR
jgi:hypothetical protein